MFEPQRKRIVTNVEDFRDHDLPYPDLRGTSDFLEGRFTRGHPALDLQRGKAQQIVEQEVCNAGDQADSVEQSLLTVLRISILLT